MNQERRSVWPILAALTAGSVAAVIASLVSLPLRSPDDLIANTASVTLVALVISLVAGVYWRRVREDAGARRRLWIFAGAGFIGAVVVLAILEAAILDRFISFGVPLAAIIFGGIALLTPPLTGASIRTWVPLAAVAGAFVVGGGLASFGDAESGDLSLDDLPVVTAPPTSALPATTAAATDTTAPVAPPAGGELVIPDDLASTTFTFAAGTATWAVPETFASSGLDVTAVGRSEELQGTVVLDGTSEFSVDLTTFVSDQDRRDSRVRDLFAADPVAAFRTAGLELPATYVEGDVFTTQVSGELTINSVTKTVTWNISARLTGGQLDVTGELDIVMTDFNVSPPSIGGFVTVEDSARLEVLFSAISA